MSAPARFSRPTNGTADSHLRYVEIARHGRVCILYLTELGDYIYNSFGGTGIAITKRRPIKRPYEHLLRIHLRSLGSLGRKKPQHYRNRVLRAIAFERDRFNLAVRAATNPGSCTWIAICAVPGMRHDSRGSQVAKLGSNLFYSTWPNH